MPIKITKDNVSKTVAAINQLVKKDVLVGIPDDAPQRASGEPSNAQLGYIHEYGSPAANIPPRPFLIPGVADAQAQITEVLGKGGKAALEGDAAAAMRALTAAGLIAQDAVRAKITNGPFTPLAASTLAARAAKGFAGTKPLIETGKMRMAVTYVIRDK